ERAQSDRSEALAHLMDHWADTLAEIRCLLPELARAGALSSVIRFLPEERLDEAVTIAGGLEDRAARAELFSDLIPHLPSLLLRRVLDMAATWGAETASGFLVLATPFLPPDLAGEVLAGFQPSSDGWPVARAVVALLPRLSVADLSKVPSLCHHLGPSGSWLLRRALPHLPETEWTLALTRILADLSDLPNGTQRSGAFREILVSAPPPLLAIVLMSAKEEEKAGLVEELDSLAPRLPESALPVALNIALRERDGRKRASALLALIPFLAPEDEATALIEVVRVSSKLEAANQAGLLFSLASRLRGAAVGSVLQQALAAARECNKKEDRKDLLLIAVALLDRPWPELAAPPAGKGLVLHSSALWSMVFEGIATVHHSARAEILRQAAASLPSELLASAWEFALEDWSEVRLPALKALARRLGELPIEQMLAFVWFQGSKRERSAVLRTAVAAIPLDRLKILTTRLRGRPSGRRRLLGLIDASARRVASVSTDQLRELLALSATVDDMAVTATGLWWLGLHAPADRGTDVMAQALEAFCMIREEGQRVEMLLRMSLHAPDRLQSDLLARTMDLEEEADRAAFLAGLALRWPEAVSTFLDGMTDEGLSSSSRAKVLRALGGHLAPAKLDRVLTQLWRLNDEEDRLAALVGLSSHLSGELWEEAREHVSHLSSEALVARGLVALCPGAPPEFLPELLREARGLPGKLRLLILHSLIPRFFVDLPFEKLVDEALELGDEGLWVKVLAPAAASVPQAQRQRAWRAFQGLPL